MKFQSCAQGPRAQSDPVGAWSGAWSGPASVRVSPAIPANCVARSGTLGRARSMTSC